MLGRCKKKCLEDGRGRRGDVSFKVHSSLVPCTDTAAALAYRTHSSHLRRAVVESWERGLRVCMRRVGGLVNE